MVRDNVNGSFAQGSNTSVFHVADDPRDMSTVPISADALFVTVQVAEGSSLTMVDEAWYRVRAVILGQLTNISYTLAASFLLKFSPRVRVVSLVHPENIFDISVTLLVLKLLKSKVVRAVHEPNI